MYKGSFHNIAGVTHKDLPIPPHNHKDGTLLIVEETIKALKRNGISVTKKQVWTYYNWWWDFVKKTIEDGVGERIALPFMGQLTPKASGLMDDIWEMLPPFVKESVKRDKIPSEELLKIYQDPALSEELVRRMALLPPYMKVHQFLHSPNNKPKTDERATRVRPGFLDDQAEPGMADDDSSLQGTDPEGQGV